MRAALNLARTGLGRTWPNPTVGCVIVKNDIVLGRARTADSGRPHAETIALKQAGASAKGASAYVSLEPCAHQGETGPCAQALIEAGVSRVVVACTDNDPRVSGKGIEILQKAGIEVVTCVLEQEALNLNKGFFLCNEKKRPLITLKTASSLDSKIATLSGESKWITSAVARAYGHVERAQHDVILVGVNTVLSDNPSLNARLDGHDHKGVRVVLDTTLKLRGDKQLFDTVDKNPVWIITSKSEKDAKHLIGKGAQIITVPVNNEGYIDLNGAMQALAELGITRVLVEGGARILTSFMRENLFDRLIWFRASSIIGSEGLSAVQETGLSSLKHKINLNLTERRILGEDVLDIYEREQ